MPQDLLEIAREHHRAGRLRQAEEVYRRRLAEAADDPTALDALGTLLVQAGALDEAVALISRATDLLPEDAAAWHNLGVALMHSGNIEPAIAALTESAALDTHRGETFAMLGRAYTLRRSVDGVSPEACEAGVAALRRAIAEGVDSAEVYHDLGVALLSADRPGESVEALSEALRRRSDYPSAWIHTARARRAAGEPGAARSALNQVLERDRTNARAWLELGHLDAAAGQFAIAAGHYRRAVARRDDLLPAWRGLADALRKNGEPAEASVADQKADELERQLRADRAASQPAATEAVQRLEERLTPQGAAAVLRAILADVTSLLPAEAVAPESIRQLFDNYAERFDQHLLGPLQYAGPETIRRAIETLYPGRRFDTFDAGCGTGLIGAALQGVTRSILGVDLSEKMIAKADERGIYSGLVCGDIVEQLAPVRAAFDLIVSADVLIYLGDLLPFVEAASHALRPGGVLVMTFESADEWEKQYDRAAFDRRSRRYRHPAVYLRRMIQICGLTERKLERFLVRVDFGKPVVGYLVVAEKA